MKIRFHAGGLLLLAALGLTGCSTVLALRFGKFQRAGRNTMPADVKRLVPVTAETPGFRRA
jgi:DMSO/TMAO reductase YedYZ molybdopterin-dependent catalytic subunit